jgi:MoaA/NifB/PqqE/SkfB family radical SAM enzyme
VNQPASMVQIGKAILSNPQIFRAKPSVNWFMYRYLRKFKVRRVGEHLVLHSHLPPLNSKAYGRFINEHLLTKMAGPSHAQIAVTNACPQNCEYCYNRDRKGAVLDTPTIKGVIRGLKAMGVFWLGFTGGEPLLKKDLVDIVGSVGEDCATKLFTTGSTLTKELAMSLKSAGLYSVSVSLDHWRQEEHDRVRRYEGAFQTALRAIRIFQDLGGIDVGVSAVLSPEMIRRRQVEKFLGFLQGLGIHEAWISETKPSVPESWDGAGVITEDERLELVRFQDRYNKEGGMTVNYLGHFEGREHFGCCAGHKMLYVDAFGYVSPCVFTPITFGNVRETAISEIYRSMRARFPTENRCFINNNFRLLRKNQARGTPIGAEETRKLMEEVRFGPYARFFQLHYGRKGA